MKSLQDHLNEGLNEGIHMQNIFRGIDPESKKQLEDNIKKMNDILKKMNVGDFKYECTIRTVHFTVGRYIWTFEMDFLDKEIQFEAIPAYGSFTASDEVVKFYKSIGLVLSQMDKIKEIEEILKDNNRIMQKFDM